MNPNKETMHDRIKRYGELKKNPMADSRTVYELKKSFEMVDMNNLSDEEKRIIFQD